MVSILRVTQSRGAQWQDPLLVNAMQDGSRCLNCGCYPHMTVFYIFIYIFFSPGNGARIHRCHYPSAHVCLLPRRQDCILKVLGGYSFLSQVTLEALTIHTDPGWKCLSKPCVLECFEILLQKAFSHRVEKHHLYSSFAVAFLPRIFLLSVNIGGEALTSSTLQMAFF